MKWAKLLLLFAILLIIFIGQIYLQAQISLYKFKLKKVNKKIDELTNNIKKIEININKLKNPQFLLKIKNEKFKYLQPPKKTYYIEIEQ